MWGTTVSCHGIGGPAALVSIGPHHGGRAQVTLLINNIFLIISSYLIAFAPHRWWYIGRIFLFESSCIATAGAKPGLSGRPDRHVMCAISTMHHQG
jgi:hypothetical protein